MAFDVYFFKVSKRENSTARPALSAGSLFRCTLKDQTSINHPTFLVDFGSDPSTVPDFNYCYVGTWGKYYFLSGGWSANHNLWEGAFTVDVLATYKDAILSTTQYVSYSSVSGGTWLPDTRIPITKDATTDYNEVSLSSIFSNGGLYILSYIGRVSTGLVALGKASLDALINNISGSEDNFDQDTFDQVVNYFGNTRPISAEEALYAMTQVTTQSDILGKAYGTAPSCLRSCIYTPLVVPGSADTRIYLGNYDTQVTGISVPGTPITGQVSVNIPWQHDDWRRGVCEQIYLYLPLVGMVGLSADSLISETTLTVDYSYTLTDAAIAYRVSAGNQVVGTYGGSCAINYPLGVNQQASAGQVMQSVMSGLTSTVSAGLTGNIGGMIAGIATTAYNALDTALTSHPSSVGGIGGGAGSGLSRNVVCYSVAHDTVISPSSMRQTMGVPTMAPTQLSSCSGFCQCVNAHVPAAGASLEELNAITTFLNTGFYIQ